MERTRSGNIKIRLNPERWYSGETWIGIEYYRQLALDSAFGPRDWNKINQDDCDLSKRGNITNVAMIQHYVKPFRRIGFVVR